MKPFWVGLAILFSGYLQAQVNTCNITVTGRVIDDHDESALSFSHIILLDENLMTIADENAEFEMTGLCPGRYRIEIKHVGCEPIIEEMVLTNKSQQYFVFRMEHHHELREIEVAARSQEMKTHANTQTIAGNQLNLKRMESLSDALSDTPGIGVLKSGPNLSKPMIHGVYGNRVAIFSQYAKVEDQQWGADHAPALELSEAGSVSVVKGAQGVEYGPEAIGGAIVVQPPPFETQRVFSGQIQAGVFSNGRGGFTNARLSGALLESKRLFYRFSGGWNQSGDRHTPIYQLHNTGNRHYSFSGSLGYRYKTLQISVSQSMSNQAYGILSDAHNSSLLDLQNAVDRGNPLSNPEFSYHIDNPHQLVEHYTTQINATVKPGDKSQLELNYTHQYNHRREFDQRRGPMFETPVVDLRLRTHSALFKYTQVFSNGWSMKTGAEGRLMTNVSSNETGTRPIIPNFINMQYGAFTYIQKHWKKWEFEAGIRYDYLNVNAFKWYRTSDWQQNYMPVFADFVSHTNESGTQTFTEPAFNYHNFSGVLSVIRNWSDQLTTGLRGALVTRPPNSPELFSDGLHLGSATLEYGNLNLKPENSFSGELFGAYQSERLNVSAAGFYQYFNGFILPEISGIELTIRGAFPRMNYTQTDALFYGANWRAAWDFGSGFSMNHQGALTYANDLSRNAYLPFIPPPQMRNEMIWKPINSLSKTLELAVGVRSHFKQNLAPRAIAPEALRLLSPQQIETERESGSFDIAPPPGEYHLVFARVQTSFPWKAREIQIGLMADNLLNRSYRDYLNRFRYFALDTGINIQLMLNLKF